MSCLVALELVLSAAAVLDLDGGMADLELVLAHLAHLLQHELGVLFRFDVAAHRHFRLGDGPHVKVMHLHFWVALFDLCNQILNVNFFLSWGAFHEDVDALLGDWNDGNANDNREDEGTDWISDLPCWLEIDGGRSNNDTDGHDHVAQGVAISSTDVDIALILCRVRMAMVVTFMSVVMALFSMIVVVTAQMVMSLSLMKNLHLNEIEEKTGNSGDKHNVSLKLWWRQDSVDGLLQEVHGDSNQEDDTNEGSDNLGSVPSIGQFFTGVFLGEFKAEDGNSKTDHIGSKMCSIRDNGNGARKITTDRLRNDEKYGHKRD